MSQLSTQPADDEHKEQLIQGVKVRPRLDELLLRRVEPPVVLPVQPPVAAPIVCALHALMTLLAGELGIEGGAAVMMHDWQAIRDTSDEHLLNACIAQDSFGIARALAWLQDCCGPMGFVHLTLADIAQSRAWSARFVATAFLLRTVVSASSAWRIRLHDEQLRALSYWFVQVHVDVVDDEPFPPLPAFIEPLATRLAREHNETNQWRIANGMPAKAQPQPDALTQWLRDATGDSDIPSVRAHALVSKAEIELATPNVLAKVWPNLHARVRLVHLLAIDHCLTLKRTKASTMRLTLDRVQMSNADKIPEEAVSRFLTSSRPSRGFTQFRVALLLESTFFNHIDYERELAIAHAKIKTLEQQLACAYRGNLELSQLHKRLPVDDLVSLVGSFLTTGIQPGPKGVKRRG